MTKSCSKNKSRSKSNRKMRVSSMQRGGMTPLETAFVPFGIIALQKYMQRKTKSKTMKRMSSASNRAMKRVIKKSKTRKNEKRRKN